MSRFKKRQQHSHRTGNFERGTDVYGHSGRCRGKNKVFSKFVIVDIAGSPLACYDSQEEADEAVATLYPGRRIVERTFANFGQQEAFG